MRRQIAEFLADPQHCPLCGIRWDAEPTGSADRCEHEAGWYRDFLAAYISRSKPTRRRRNKRDSDLHDDCKERLAALEALVGKSVAFEARALAAEKVAELVLAALNEKERPDSPPPAPNL